MDEPSQRPDADPPAGAPEGARSVLSGAVMFLTMGVAIALSLAAGAGIGYLVDEWAGTGPIFTLVGLVLGVVAAVALAVSSVRKYL